MGNIYTAAMGMISFQTKLEVTGNNIANVKSNGYKRDQETFRVFEEGMRKLIAEDGKLEIGTYQNQVHIDNVETNFNPGLLQVTNNPLDLTLQDKANADGTKNVSFFEVEINGQTLLTRDGHFELDEENNLSLMNGAYLLDTNGQRIKIPDGVGVSINEEGMILNKETGEEITQIQIRTVNEENTGFLKKAYGNMFQAITLDELQQNFGPLNEMLRVFDINPSLQNILKNREVLEQAQNTGELNIFDNQSIVQVKQQMLEQSNVDTSYEMNQLLMAQKGFQANAKAVMAFDKVNEKDANQLGV